jgi:uncharacterized protein YaiI (UPF0178 family)
LKEKESIFACKDDDVASLALRRKSAMMGENGNTHTHRLMTIGEFLGRRK